MLEGFKWVDQQLFYLINHVEVPAFLESLMVTITTLDRNKTFLWVGLPFLLFVWGFYQKKKAGKIFLALALVVGATDLICNRMIKKTVDRKRPNLETNLDVKLRLPYSPKGESFVSNHSANNFAAATVLAAYYPPYRLAYYAYASLVALTRPYVGVHYVSDVFAGGLIGHLIALLLLKLLFRKKSWFELGSSHDSSLMKNSAGTNG